ncbi:MAG: septal ring lytic transglycosylase RlpA family protein [Gammaproteobacteria bacterium]|nr:septal ring lytic transglycosylase RlpA family protein [Gammaproteobacteria bacterium]
MPDRNFAICLLLTGAALASACSFVVQRDGGPRPGTVNTDHIPDAVPKSEPRSKYGNPESYVVNGTRYVVMRDADGYVEKGIASWYGEQFHGRRTSSGETYDMYAMTAAHKTLPLPTYVRVTNLRNARHVILRVNDRGPFHGNRIIDLSYTAAAKLDILTAGTGVVEVRALDATADDAVAAAVPDPPVAGGNPGAFFIQVGAFVSRANAEALRDRLAAAGDILLSVSAALVDGRTLYRVRIGPLDDVEIADNLVARLGALGVNEHSIVTD